MLLGLITKKLLTHSFMLGFWEIFTWLASVKCNIIHWGCNEQVEHQIDSGWKILHIGKVQVKRGFFQRTSLPPQPFVINANIIDINTPQLRPCALTLKTGSRILHLLYMDGLKIYGKKLSEVNSLLNRSVMTLWWNLGLIKSAIPALNRERSHKAQSYCAG